MPLMTEQKRHSRRAGGLATGLVLVAAAGLVVCVAAGYLAGAREPVRIGRYTVVGPGCGVLWKARGPLAIRLRAGQRTIVATLLLKNGKNALIEPAEREWTLGPLTVYGP